MKKFILASTFMLFAVFAFASNGEKTISLEIEETLLINSSDLCSITELPMAVSMTNLETTAEAESQEILCWGFCWYCCRTCIVQNGTTYCTDWECCQDDNDQ